MSNTDTEAQAQVEPGVVDPVAEVDGGDGAPVEQTDFEIPVDDDGGELADLTSPETAPQPAETPAATPGPETPAAVPTPEGAPQEEKPVAQQPEAAAPKPEAAPPGPQAPQPEAPDTLAELEKNREVLIERLAADHFQLTPEEQQALEDQDFGPHIPKMMAKLYFMSSVNTLRQMREFAKSLPAMISQVSQTLSANTDVEKQFYDRFPMLGGENRGKFEGQVAGFAEAIKKASAATGKQLTLEELHEQVGKAVLAANGIAEPQAPKRPNGGQRGFKPAPSGVPVGQQQVVDPFAGMGMDFDQ